MRCKKHLTDVSSTVGVCATCLRHRLLSVMEHEPETKDQSQSIPNRQNPNSDRHQIQSRKKENTSDIFRSIFQPKPSSSNSAPNNHNSTFTVYANNKGMSPVSELGDDCESSKVSQPSPAQGKPRSVKRGGTTAFCFGPLVRATPTRRGGGCEKSGFPGEIRVLPTGVKSGSNSHKGNIGNCDSHLNRSRKLADFGRENHNY